MITDNAVWEMLFALLNQKLVEFGFTNVAVQQTYQPTQQGVPLKPTVALHTIDSQRYGFPEDSCYYDQQQDAIVRRESYWLERTYQVDGYSIQSPETPSNPTAFDLVDTVAAILQTGSVVEFLQAQGFGILRVQPLRVIYFVDDRGRHEQIPSFDFTLTYQQIILSTAEPITEITAEIYEV